MSRESFIKWIYGFLGAHIFTLFGAAYYVGAENNANETHRNTKEKHLTPTELKEHFMSVEEVESEFRGLNTKLDLLIEMQKGDE